eukprot:gene24755-29913_t
MIRSFYRFLFGEERGTELNNIDDEKKLRALTDFAKLVSKGCHDVNVIASTAAELEFPPASTDRITRYTMQVTGEPLVELDGKFNQLSMEALVVPSSILSHWPHVSLFSKQENAIGPTILFRRLDEASIGREEATLDLVVNKGDSASWISLPGIGKSMASISVLMKCIEALHPQGNGTLTSGGLRRLQEVYYRVGSSVYVFKLSSISGRIVVRTLMQSEWESVKVGFINPESNQRVLIVEMEEDENDPNELGFYTSSSERRAFEVTFKTLYKGRQSFFLMDPPSPAEVRMMFAAFRRFDAQGVASLGLTSATLDARMRDIGTIPRWIFASNAVVDEYLANRNRDHLDIVFEDLSYFSISNVGKHLKFFMAPYIRHGVTLPIIGEMYSVAAKEHHATLSAEEREYQLRRGEDVYEFRALSDRCKLMLASRVKTPVELYFLKHNGDAWELLEATVRYAALMVNDDGLGDFVEERCRLPRWRWYHDPGDQPLTQQHALGKGKQDQELLRVVAGTKVCERVRLFDGVHMSQNVWELEEGVLYKSTQQPNVALVESWIVFHEKKVILGHRVSKSKVTQHVFKTSIVDNALQGLGMLEERGREYEMLIIGVNDMSLEKPTGMVFAREQPATAAASKSTVVKRVEEATDMKQAADGFWTIGVVNTTRNRSADETSYEKKGLKEWQELLKRGSTAAWTNADRVMTVVARVEVFGLPSFELPEGKTQLHEKQSRGVDVAQQPESSTPANRKRKQTGEKSVVARATVKTIFLLPPINILGFSVVDLGVDSAAFFDYECLWQYLNPTMQQGPDLV